MSNFCNIHFTDDNGMTALHLASDNGHLETVMLLKEQGSDIHATNNNGMTALHLASWKNHSKIVMYLVKQGSDVNAKDNNGMTALHLASNQEVTYENMVAMMMEISPLPNAAMGVYDIDDIDDIDNI